MADDHFCLDKNLERRGVKSDKLGPKFSLRETVNFRGAFFSVIGLSADTVTLKARSRKIGRNKPCYCDSGKKFKNCCGLANEK